MYLVQNALFDDTNVVFGYTLGAFYKNDDADLVVLNILVDNQIHHQ